jgi:hypothetical protein
MRRRTVAVVALLATCLVACAQLLAAEAEAQPAQKKKVAAVVASWFPNSHPDVILGRIIKTYTMDGKGEAPQLQLVSVYRDKPTDRDITPQLAQEYGFKVCDTIADALTLGTGKLAVDGVILSTEWADYPVSPTGQTMYPHRRMFEEIAKVFKDSGRVAPVFVDKHMAYDWEGSKWIYDTAQEMKIPLMAGSSVPVAWRRPPVDVKDDVELKQIVGLSYHTLDGYGFHGMEMVQTLAERRKGGETGIKSVQCLVDNAVWEAADKLYDSALLDAALGRLRRKLPEGKTVRDLVPNPVLFVMDYADGLRVCLFTLNGFVGEWAAAWRYADGATESTLFWLQDGVPFMHFAYQVKGIEQMILTGQPAWPAERTLMTSGALDACLISKMQGGKPIETPYLTFPYEAGWRWQQPPEP